jgi:molybdopterin-guanine dinucleotide biosynthesis protein A
MRETPGPTARADAGTPRVSAAILAGGRGTRLGGRDKSTLEIDGRTLLARQAAVLHELTDDILLVGVRAPDQSERAVPAGLRVVADERPGCGPLGGLYTALRACAAPQLLVVACDMPFLSAPFLRFLVDAGREVDAALVGSDDGYHPLCASYRTSCLAAIGHRLDHGRLKLKELLEDVRVRAITPLEVARFGPEQMLLFNINTPDDYARAGHLAGGAVPLS